MTASPLPRLAWLDVLDASGRVLHSVDVRHWPLRLGRALNNDVVLSDPAVAAHHLTIDWDPPSDAPALIVGQTRNGVRVGRQHLTAGTRQTLARDADSTVGLGGLQVRLRLPHAPLMEEVLLTTGRRQALALASLAVLTLLLALISDWVRMPPHDDWWRPATLVLRWVVTVSAWTLLWALASKLFRHQFDFWGHLGIVLRTSVVVLLASAVLPTLAASLDWPWLWHVSQTQLEGVWGAWLIWRHARRVLPQHARRVAVGVLAAWVLMSSYVALTHWQHHGRWWPQPYMPDLPLPGLRWHSTQPVNDFLQEAQSLREPLESDVQKAREEKDLPESD